MADPRRFDPDLEWLDHVRPVGLVVAASLLKELGLAPALQTRADNAAIAELLDDDRENPALADPWAFAERILEWPAARVAGAPGGPPLPDELFIKLPEHDTVLEPHWAVAGLGGGWQLLVRIEAAGVKPDGRGALAGWEATPQQRFERLLRETGIPIGVLLADDELRLVYAPRGETSGWLGFPLRPLATVAGRPMLGGLKLMLDRARLFTDPENKRLPALLQASREAQTAVSAALAEQVVGALHELLRGLGAAEPALITALSAERPQHLYEGLLTVLLRLVFVLYAEDRDLIPSRTDAEARAFYEQGYSVRGLHAKLLEDQARHPDTIEERLGAWGRLLALFRLIHRGDHTGWIRARGGKLFDPDAFLFLEGRASPEEAPRVARISDGVVLRILDGLLTLKGERLSYRTLDVEQIGSVYETVMGFTVLRAAGPALAIRAGKHNRTPVFVDLAELAALKPEERLRRLKEGAQRGALTAKQQDAIKKAAGADAIAAALDGIVDERGSPDRRALPPGTPILQPTDERRRTGSHYTPRSLTEPIVRHALEPAFERLGPDARPEDVLDLKVCDMAMGSGAFLVEACRALAARLVQAWARWPQTRPKLPPDEDEELHARRLIAQRCLYGVDKNPMATDLAKLSLWLATLARDHEFTFLDHALKCGDSLVGLGAAQIAAMHWDTSKPGQPLFRQFVADRVAEATKARAEIRSAPDDTARAILEQKHRFVESRVEHVRVLGDAVLSAFFAEDKPNARERRRATVESWVASIGSTKWGELETAAASLRAGVYPLTPFHWSIEFPEVFTRVNGGFDAIVGNPPFLGGKRISGSLGRMIPTWLATLHSGASGNADLVVHFYRRAFELLRDGAAFGLIATNTIAQGDTRRAGLAWLGTHGGQIINVRRRVRWPGEAAVVVSVVVVARGETCVPRFIDERPVEFISAFFSDRGSHEDPARLQSNRNKSFVGCDIKGQGFLFADDDPAATTTTVMRSLIAADARNEQCIRPYIGGEELNTSPTQSARRWVIYFDEMNEMEARQWPALLRIVEEKVKPDRANKAKELAEWPWWQFWRVRAELYAAIAPFNIVLVTGAAAVMHHMIAQLPSNLVFSHKTVVFAFDNWSAFSCLQCSVHELWSRQFGTTFGSVDALTYNPSQVFQTFPFPSDFESESKVEAIGQAYHVHRATLMVTRNEGMTKTYNRFHNRSETAADIVRLRELHAEMDRAVLEAYGWHDLAECAAPIFLDESNEDDYTYQGRLFWPADFRDEVLARLIALNAERHAEEVHLGIAPGMKGGQHEAEDEGALDNELTE